MNFRVHRLQSLQFIRSTQNKKKTFSMEPGFELRTPNLKTDPLPLYYLALNLWLKLCTISTCISPKSFKYWITVTLGDSKSYIKLTASIRFFEKYLKWLIFLFKNLIFDLFDLIQIDHFNSIQNHLKYYSFFY